MLYHFVVHILDYTHGASQSSTHIIMCLLQCSIPHFHAATTKRTCDMERVKIRVSQCPEKSPASMSQKLSRASKILL